ncbi:hypothetical protein SMGD1_0031 [Sulfurimonas gotlandica GD1]|uniref:Vitamin K epoxide reductase domain-containing protein n=1 Tax=Sulfurimonas gotlandica (strain DSM 19862 / JCM 16533 / GD1) TaxID=929558 RepID=H1FRK5_SULGG|nr:hypothetical protein [Sulfurimonas gotlandica]EHP28558.1 hypothetical protein SMGD1_0031 [Sulfurimonas gotlandica GD1]
MILTPEVLAIFILNALFAFFGIIAFILSVKIYFGWDLNSVSKKQYKLEKLSYLGATIIKYIFIIKVPLFLFFVFTLDKISNVLTGAMCGAGVVDATDTGTALFVLKIINLYIFAYWIVLHNEDMKHENQPFVKQKFGIFILAFFLFMAELIIEGIMFGSIEIDKMVSCCGTLYSSSSTSAISSIFALDTTFLLSLFYGIFLLIIFFYFIKNRYLFAISNAFFTIISLVTLIVFFGTYIYELPSHHCPFCYLQSDYYFVGYLIYTLLFLGTFYGLVVGFIESSKEDRDKSYKKSVIFNTLYVILLSSFVMIYFIKNGVWL